MASNKKNTPPVPPIGEVVIQRPMEDVMHQSMMPYSEYVILERALPRVEDGLKPVQRRILYTMHELSLTPDKPHRKCARIVGDCLGKYHPHGDTSVYDALARMAQPFVMRGMLVDGHGNFGSIDGDSPAAMRYTEARMTKLAMELLRDIEKDTVSFHLNFDDTQKEPDMLPGRFPNLLVNGASGIAVGLATNIPPHNLSEAIDAVLAQLENPAITVDELMVFIPAPDFPTGGILLKDDELKLAYETGRGKLQVRAKVDIEQGNAGRTLLVITEMPYQVGKAQLLEKILRLSEDKKALLSGIHDIRDESDRTGMRAVIELKRDVDPEKMLNILYKYSDLQTTFGVNMVAIAGGKPVQMGLREIIAHYIRHQKDVITRRTQYELEQALARAHILEGLIVALDNLDEVIALIRASKTPKEARVRLVERFDLTEIQAQAILDMRLQRLTNLEIISLREEFAELMKLISKLEAILKSEKKLIRVIADELGQVREKYADPRRTRIMDKPEAVIVIQEEVPEPEETWVLVTRNGFVKRLQPRVYDRFIQSGDTLEPPQYLFQTMTDKKLLFVSSTGMCYPLTVEQLPDARPKDRGLPLPGVLQGFESDETLVNLLLMPDEPYTGNLTCITSDGRIKRTELSEYAVRKARYAALNAKDAQLVCAFIETDEEYLLTFTRQGMAICFALKEAPITGRATAGVKAVSLAPGDQVISAFQHDFEGEAIIATDRGCFKRCLAVDFDPQARGGKGLKAIQFNKNNSNGTQLISALFVTKPYDLIVTQKSGTFTTVNSEWIKVEMRAGKGQPLVVAVLDDIVTGVSRKLI